VSNADWWREAITAYEQALGVSPFDFGPVADALAERGRVVARRFFVRRAARPCSRMIAATVFLLTFHPAARRSAVIRGDPYLPW